ncbi:timeless protein-domain-containing protein [Suillus subaureus]|uniref:Timeless protein-domain-containing protein n=1 Tax=Suillus subaureus TaxID=48587 RepID=A0A9P7EDN4_9AGAM|nr:timeless protein-domain-containing protein [Suillus subaureus]KAG1818982.1 timeless protein-domain-containing protein [Suillus subaureus]
MDDDVVSIHSSHESGMEEVDRRAILEPVVQRVVDALGGYEGGAYRMGDEVSGCLRDLKKLWRKDDTDDERTVARIFWETRVLPNDLVPILLATAGKGLVEDKRAIACADLMTAMTWPIDMAEELQELDEELDKGTDYTQLMFSHLNYKAALLTPGVMQALFGIVLPPISKPAKERKERDGQIVNLILHLIRNLIFIKDLPANTHLSADQAEYSSLQTRLVKALSETHTLDLLLTIAANTSNDSLFNASSTLVLEIFYLLFRGVKPHLLAIDQSKVESLLIFLCCILTSLQQPAQNLHRLLAAEDKKKKDLARNASSRHSRFGTTISVQLKPSKKSVAPNADIEGPNDPASGSRPLVLHRQAAITRESQDSPSGFCPRISFLRFLLKDIKSERPKIKEKDHLRLLYVTKWFLEFFLTSRSNEKAVEEQRKWNLGLVAEVTDRGWIIWVLKRMRQAMDEKPKMWNELQAGIECLTQLLLLIDIMSSSVISDPQLNEAAAILQQQLIYNGEVLDISLESLRSYKEGTQSLAYLNASVHLAYALLRMLERWGKENTGAVYVRKKKPGKRKKATGQRLADEDGVPDVENEPDGDSEEDVVHETMFTFDAFEMKFANSEITKTLLTYLSRYRDFDSPEFMKRAVNLIHRQVVKAKAEGLYFNVSTLNLFKIILDDQKSLPKDQSSKDLVKLVNFILHKFFKALEGEPFLAVEAFFPKNRGHWKLYSSWEPEQKGRHERETVEDTRFPPEVQVKKGYSWSEQIGIAIAALVDDGKTELVEWVKDILVLVIRQRDKIIEETDNKLKDDDTDLDDDEQKKLTPSAEAISKFIDYLIPYISDEHAEAATKNSILKLMFRLLKFTIYDDDGDELQWTVPAAILPSDLQSSLNVIDQFLQHPIDLDGKKASQLLSKKPRRQRRRRSLSNSDVELVDDDEPKRKRREKKKKEETQYKSAQFIEDSDAEYGDMEAFLEREKALRDKAVMAAAQSGKIGTMRATGTKKRRRKGKDVEAKKKGKVGNPENQSAGESSADENVSDGEDDILGTMRRSRSSTPESQPAPRARPRPRPVPKRSAKQAMSTDAESEGDAGMDTAGV